MKNKWLIIGIAVVVIAAGIFACQPATPTIPAAPTPAEEPTTPVVGPSGVIEVTAEELVKQFLANPNKYKKGTVFQISGTLIKPGDYTDQNMGLINSFTLGPIIKISPYVHGFVSIDAWTIDIKKGTNWDNIKLNQTLNGVNHGDWVVIRGEFEMWNPNDKYRKEALIENVSLISITPEGGPIELTKAAGKYIEPPLAKGKLELTYQVSSNGNVEGTVKNISQLRAQVAIEMKWIDRAGQTFLGYDSLQNFGSRKIIEPGQVEAFTILAPIFPYSIARYEITFSGLYFFSY